MVDAFTWARATAPATWGAEADEIDTRLWAKEEARRARMSDSARAEEDERNAAAVAAIREAIRAEEEEKEKEVHTPVRVWQTEPEENSLEDALWAMPWARDLELKYAGTYDCSAMSEKDYASFMRWLCARGFNVCAYGHRAIVCAVDENLPPMEWMSTKPVATGPMYVPRFCVRCDPANPAEGCAYEHGDTIARSSERCKFGDACTGPKRAACLRMHPGEIWTATSVIRRCVSACAGH